MSRLPVRKQLTLAVCLQVLSSGQVSAQSVQAVRVPDGQLRLDGRVEEAVWSSVSAATNFVQREPREGEPASNRTAVQFAYDDQALWIAARLHSTDARAVRALISRHDRDNGSDQLIVSLDTNQDRRTAYNFGVTAAGVRFDFFHRSDDGGDTSYAFDPTWEVAVRRDSLGWTAEMRIPFSQLRFSSRDDLTWGVNIVRRVPAQDEWSFWVLVPRTEAAWSSRMGTLTGIHGVRPSRRVELRPFFATDARFATKGPSPDPFVDSRSLHVRAGGEMKVGLGPGFTVDATVNPDFGQVEADPAEVNLTAFETVFDERRPFFLEGAELLDARGLFYSRRIGAPPAGRPNASYAEVRDHSTILGAAKLTGRTRGGLSLAALAAATARERVATYSNDSATFGESVVAPFTNYAALRARQEFGRNASTIGGFFSVVHRDLEPGSALAAQLNRTALSGLADMQWRWADGRYDVTAFAGGTAIDGDSAAILLQQRSSRRYWQRPDAESHRLDPARRAMSGTLAGISHRKVSGRPWLWEASLEQATPGLEANDFGAISSVDYRTLSYRAAYREPRPSALLRSYEIGAIHDVEWSVDGIRRASVVTPYVDVILPDFARVTLVGDVFMRGLSDRLTRGGPLMATGKRWELQLNVDNRAGARTRWAVELETGRGELGNWNQEVEGLIAIRPGTQWELRIEPDWTSAIDPRQYVTTLSGVREETYGRRYIFGSVHRHQVSLRLRLNYTLTPKLSLESYAEPFASSGRFSQLGELAVPRQTDLRIYGSSPGTTVEPTEEGGYLVRDGQATFPLPPLDFNVRALRSNVVLRWEWRLGSTAYLVWQQDREGSLAFDSVRPTDIWGAFRTKGGHSIALKVDYWLPVQ